MRGQPENCPRFSAVLWAGHRYLPLHRPQLPQAGGTRLRQVGHRPGRQEEVRRQESDREQDTDAERSHRAGRTQTPPQSQHFGVRRLRRGQDEIFRKAQHYERQHQLCLPRSQGRTAAGHREPVESQGVRH